ncbi:transglycosylase SLT domain-containing protein [Piscinibacter gummiphilus]|uniref:Transglycosylase SLT domain-containing protein n=1 Tax=Piscinibacter gummiphilus TaxID=946333 RepID=A0ABZ0CN57_9BURK|nr:transglycosylase SLT domain-containing protein [Piscinibacter gummiphilus]WOB06324.1 transglycosylase SLT domain-containing protein [Piscinibacter gummiphilus]
MRLIPCLLSFRLRHGVVLTLAAVLAACATRIEAPDQRADIPAVIAQVELPGGAASAPAAASAVAPAASAASAPADGGGPVAAAPVDPLRPEEPVDLESKTANIDLWERVRRGFTMPDLETPLVRTGEQWYSSRPDYVARMTERGSRYLFHIVEEVERRGMPTELALLPFIESAFNPQAISSAKASGMWQFMPATGKNFDLRQNVFRDDRRDVLASTRAALDYLQKLYNMFGDWHLALAAYNWGEGNVMRAIARNKRAGKPAGYLDLRMPNETAYYVPKLQAVKNIVARPDAFSLTLPPLANHPYFLSVPIERDIDVATAVQLAGISRDEFMTLNPQMNKPVILAAGTPQILLPYDNASLFVRNVAAHRGPFATWTAWVAPKTVKPSEAAKQFGISEAELRDVNKIPPRMLVKAGSTLLVPRSESLLKDVSVHLADNAVMTLAPEALPPRRITHRAVKGDTVASIARRYRVSASQVAVWNKVAAGASFAAGHSVVVYVPQRQPAVRSSAKAKKPAIKRKATATSRKRR